MGCSVVVGGCHLPVTNRGTIKVAATARQLNPDISGKSRIFLSCVKILHDIPINDQVRAIFPISLSPVCVLLPSCNFDYRNQTRESNSKVTKRPFFTGRNRIFLCATFSHCPDEPCAS